MSFSANPLTGDISAKKDSNAINQSLKNLVSTSYYERPFQPWVGSKVKKILFEPADYISMNDLKSSLMEIIGNFEPRVSVDSLIVEDMSDYNAYNIILVYKINNTDEVVHTEIVLKRLR